MLGRVVRRLVRSVSGYELERIGHSYGLIDPERRREAWFSYNSTLMTLFADLEITMVLDVGANTGQFAEGIREFFGGPIHSFEPVAATHAVLAERAAADRQWHTHRFALGSTTTTGQIHLSPASDFNSLLAANEYCVERFGERTRPTEVESVSIRRLEDVLPELAPGMLRQRVFLKMDTQGYDLDVFRGAGSALPHVVALQSEVSLVACYESMPHWTENVVEYERSGFGIVGLYPVSMDAGRVIEYDCLMSRGRHVEGQCATLARPEGGESSSD